jgi:hypothetical protein
MPSGFGLADSGPHAALDVRHAKQARSGAVAIASLKAGKRRFLKIEATSECPCARTETATQTRVLWLGMLVMADPR